MVLNEEITVSIGTKRNGAEAESIWIVQILQQLLIIKFTHQKWTN